MNENYHQFSGEEYEEHNTAAIDPTKSTPAYHIQKAEDALNVLKNVVKEGGWKRILKHKSGVVVYSKSGEIGDNKLPIFMGQHEIEGFQPQSVFSVVGMRRLWDELYEEGNLVENLDETTSLTYMVMQGMAGSKTRDFSLVEKVDCSQDGTIFFVSTSVDTPKIPHCVGKVRANIKLNGWILEPISKVPPTTKATYVLQSDVRGWVPSVFANKYLARRPLVLHTIKSYLQKNGSPPVIVVSPPNSLRSSLAISHSTEDLGDVEEEDIIETKVVRQKISFINEDMDLPEVSNVHVTREVNLSEVSNVHVTREVNLSEVSNVHVTREARVAPEYTLDDVYLNDDGKATDLSSHQSPTATINDEHLSSGVSSASSEASSDSEEEVVESPEPTKQMVIHRHTELVQNALKNLKSLYNDLDGWALYTENKGAKVYTMDSGRSMPIMRGDATYIGCTPDDILSVVASLEFKKLWDDRFDEGATCERWGLNDTLTRVATKGTFPVSGRDMALINTVDRDPETGITWFASTSVVDQAIPLSKKHVRAELATAGWVLKPKKDESGAVKAVDVSYIVNIDIKLDSIPSAILKSISMQTPMCVAKVDEVMQKHGFPPYVKRMTGEVELKHGEFDVKTSQCDFTCEVGGKGIIEIQTSMKMYPNGFDVSVEPEGAKVELVHDNLELIRLTMPMGADSHEITVVITKNTSKGMRKTCNRSQDVPVASPEEAVAPILSSTTPSQVKKKTKRNAVDPKHAAKGESPNFSLVDREPIGELTMEVIDTRSNESAIPTDDPVDDTLPTISAKRRSIQMSPLIPPNSTVISSQISGNSKDEPASYNKFNDEMIPPPKSSKRRTIGGNPVIISRRETNLFDTDFIKNIRFDSQQIGLIIASMVLAYYAGKLSNCYIS